MAEIADAMTLDISRIGYERQAFIEISRITSLNNEATAFMLK